MRRRHLYVIAVLACLSFFVVFGCGRQEKADAPNAPELKTPDTSSEKKKTGTIVGRIVYRGIAPGEHRLKVNKNNEVCGEYQNVEELLVNPANKGIKWAVVNVKGQVSGDFVHQEKTLDQKGCRFQPHVLAVMAGDSVNVLNSDGVLHNIHTFSVNNPPFNEAQPKFKKKITKTFSSAPEQIRIKCDVHGWMAGWVVVVQNPYYGVTNENGEFRIENVPVGRQLLEAWHETLGTALMDVEVEENKEAKVNTLEWSLKSAGDNAPKKKGTTVAKPVFDASCSACHGSTGKGDGLAAASMPNKPANLTLDTTQKKSDTELEKTIRDGRQEKGMPPWKNALTGQQIKDLVAYIRYLGGK